VSGRFSIEVPEGAAGSRADRYMADATGLSRAYVQRLISDAAVFIGILALFAAALLGDRAIPGARARKESS
jgi:hypothetical protein